MNQINKTVNQTKAKANVKLNNDIYQQLKFWGLDPNVIDKELFKQHKEIIQLHYDKIKTWLAIKSAGTISFTVLLINTWGNIYLTILFSISFLYALTGSVSANRKYNIILNTLLKKLEEEHIPNNQKLGHK